MAYASVTSSAQSLHIYILMLVLGGDHSEVRNKSPANSHKTQCNGAVQPPNDGLDLMVNIFPNMQNIL